MTTMEAVARALRVLERARGEEVMAAIMAPLEHLVRFQVHAPPLQCKPPKCSVYQVRIICRDQQELPENSTVVCVKGRKSR